MKTENPLTFVETCLNADRIKSKAATLTNKRQQTLLPTVQSEPIIPVLLAVPKFNGCRIYQFGAEEQNGVRNSQTHNSFLMRYE